MSKLKLKQIFTDTVIKAGVGVVLFKGNKVLAGERIGSHGEGHLSFAGGHLEATDLLTTHPLGGFGVCAEREVSEETGIICRAISPDNYRQDLFTTFDILSEDGHKAYVTPYILAEYLHGGDGYTENGIDYVKPREPKKCKVWQWFTLDELAERIKSEKQRTWIPIHQVLYYMKQHWRT